MATRLLLALVFASFALGLSACKKSAKDLKAAEEAKWRAEQKNKAIKNYQEIVKKYPESPFAAKAQERLRALGPAPTPAKK
jgi:outer membrane protein assembly factor BamD (BamD/ComL family)